MASVTGDVKYEMGIGNGGLRIETIRKRDSIWRKIEPNTCWISIFFRVDLC
jgi:hypothetical protein